MADKDTNVPNKNDFISREAAISEILSEPTDAHYPSWYAEKLKQVPAADVRPVVRCKDCMHAPLPGDCEGNDMEWPKIDGIYEDCTCPHCCADNWYSTRPDPDGFCEKGERREPNLDTTKGDDHD